MNGNQLSAANQPLSRSPNNGHDDATRAQAINDGANRTEGLGEPLAIEQVAELLGCSAWTVRQRYLRQGLPYLQARPRGKLVFFREQVITWALRRQRQKGGIAR